MHPTQNGPGNTHRPAAPRVRSQETKYCRIPQWLYETGISLQAIATYGWLHGRYGHFDRVMPSYNRLAKELTVSRGSVIAYVKELVAVGAIRVATSGAAGRQTNEYVIAFNEPFPVATGQHTDRGVVSPLTSTGQHSDPGGQRAVQEENVFKKTSEDSLSSNAVANAPAASPEPPVEREKPASPDKTTTTQPAAPAGEDTDAPSVADAWRTARGGARVRRTEAAIAAQAAQLLADGHAVEHLKAVAAWMAGLGWIDLERAVTHREAPRPAAAARPARPTWCGHYDCDEVSRMRDVELDNGLRAVQRCPECHPDAVAVSMAPLSGTDATVAGWAAVAAQLAAGEDRAAVGRPAGRRPRGGARSSTADIDYSTVPINL